MSTLSDYNPNQSFSLLLQGPTGARKTTTALHFPFPYIVDCDNNLGGPVRWLTEHKIDPKTVKYKIVEIDDEGKQVPKEACYQRMMGAITEGLNDKDVQTIILDSTSRIQDYLKDYIKSQGKSGFDLWDLLGYMWTELINRIKSHRKMLVVIAHEKVSKDEVSQVNQFFLDIQGRAGDTLGRLFSDVWRADVEEVGGAHKYFVRTLPTIRNPGLKCSLGLPAKFEFDWKLIEGKMKT
jgi:hypothetical protein